MRRLRAMLGKSIFCLAHVRHCPCLRRSNLFPRTGVRSNLFIGVLNTAQQRQALLKIDAAHGEQLGSGLNRAVSVRDLARERVSVRPLEFVCLHA